MLVPMYSDGLTWSTAVDSDIPNPGSSCQTRTLKNGLWVLVYNDTERGRHSLAVSLSDDEGQTWKWTRHVERDDAEEQPTTFHSPLPRDAPRKSIKHAHFDVDWIKQGDQ